ncbi:GTP-binding protein [Pseudanabaena sp. FACHB-1277]|uniref:GTP-binding protein n=1 Tax=Pseudanabaena cinerea FACHB-1277 TaxID=2949581 RepID=A0A926Z5T5_9CYAN|nr:Rab family GTPase [Pseudanabaena cinerea]MBD2149947.1 GTP-binding protein [Pseudanabaena cinerea FACHB-1277]
MHSTSKVIAQKICLVGDFSVGKTSLIRQFVDQQFSDQYLSTVGVKISRKLVSLSNQANLSSEDNLQLQLIVWDIEGHTKFKSIAPNYLQGAKGAVIVGDVTRQSTIQNLESHIHLIHSVNPKSVLVIALNKVDLIKPSEQEKLLNYLCLKLSVTKDTIKLTSAKTGEGVDEIFYNLTQQILSIG